MVKTCLIIFSVTILYVLYHYQGSSDFFLAYLSRARLFEDAQARSYYYQWGMGFILLGLVPLGIVVFGFRDHPGEYGFVFRRPLVSLMVAIAGMAVITPLVYFGSTRMELAAVYPQVQNASRSAALFWKSALFYFFYYVGYEMTFRGFLFMGIKDDVGEMQAVMISLALTVLLHITQPQLETLMAVLAGLAFPIVVLRLRSIWPVVLIHAYVGISLNYWIILRQGGFGA
jgi:hypothetical protein